ncbi:MAG TPA: hypothetical protein VK184_20860 [Nostocaceae cyanobacterium]|nr:hypothetical protein [Nostocaceae cyanobacterium]
MVLLFPLCQTTFTVGWAVACFSVGVERRRGEACRRLTQHRTWQSPPNVGFHFPAGRYANVQPNLQEFI